MRASCCIGTIKCGMTDENHDPGPIVIQSAVRIAVNASGNACGFSGITRRDSIRPLAVATSFCPRTTMRPVEVLNVPSISRGTAAIGSTRPMTFKSWPTRSKPTTGSSFSFHKDARRRLPIAWPLSEPSLSNRCCIMLAHVRPHSSSAHKAANAIRKSPGGRIGNSSRKRPLDPPLSATVTIAVISFVNCRSADNVAAKPWPPPSATTFCKSYSRPTSRWVA